ncbi:carbohydrate ABC transporter permease [Paenibacillus sp. SYP-B4298]|uniref:carbohydrate ABC transporter permease n=1 Tax=Paenibacillus sp. SYP-B4298 TaxID=2996034 RepID=UPI0022DE0B38|nr:carbohydrate ABC transporter permease [Paenibacillus sp. SYP-B4298]
MVFRKNSVAYGYVGLALLAFLFPIIWVMLTSIKTPAQAFQIPPVWLFTPTLESYFIVFSKQPFLYYFLNSLIVTVLSTAFSLLAGTLAGYSLARFRIREQKWISFTVFFTKMFPPIVLVVPFFILFRQLGGTDNLFTLTLTYTSFNLPFVIWLMWGFLKELPESLEESAAIDGTTRFGAMWRIMLPLAMPGFAVAAIFCAMNSWNEFLFALNLTGTQAKTLPVMAANFVTQEAILWGPVTATGTMLMIPMFIFTLLIQKHLVSGLTMGAVK